MKTDLEIFRQFGKKNKNTERINGTNCLVYTRVSSKEQETGFSLDIQKRVIEETCINDNYKILAYFGGVYESAKNDERNEFNRMLKFARNSKEKISVIMVYSVDRFSRSGANAIYIADQLRKENIKIFAVTQPSDTFTPSGKMQQNMQFVFSEYDNDLRREKCTSGMKEMLLNGYWCTKAPLGYDQITRKKRYNKDLAERQVITINETGKLIRKAFYWKAEDELTNSEILKKLKLLGLKMSKQTLSDMFTNPFYCGLMSHNLLNGEVVKGRHPAIISKEIFLKANDIKTRNTKSSNTVDYTYIPLKNFLKCADCGSSFCGYMVRKKNLWYYKCNLTGCKCNKSAKMLHELFEKELEKYSIDEKYIEPIKNGFINYFHGANETTQENVTQLKNRLTEISKKIEAIEERFAIGVIERELYEKHIGNYRKERLAISTEIANNELGGSNLEKRVEKYCKLLSNLKLLWTSNGYRGKLELQELIFPQGILFDRKNNSFRTPEINEVTFIMSQIARDTDPKQKADSSHCNYLSASVPRRGLEPLSLAAYAPQAYLYTNSNTWAYFPKTIGTNTRAFLS